MQSTCSIWPDVPCPGLQYFSTLTHNVTIFEKKKKKKKKERILYIKCVFWISLQFLLKNFPLWEELNEQLSQMYIHFSVKYSFIPFNFNETCFSPTGFRKVLKYKLLWKILQWEPSCSMRTDGRTARHDEANSSFWQFCKRGKNHPFLHLLLLFTPCFQSRPRYSHSHRLSQFSLPSLQV